jgi:DNA ligase D-like protein (predicted ligase)
MWVYARGKYEVTKDKKDGFYFCLRSREVNAEYRLIDTKSKDWLLERLDVPQVDWLRDPIEPMLAHSRSEPPDSSDYLYEVKWDGIRAMIALDEGQLTIRSRSQRDITRLFPELLIPDEAFRAASALFDAEIVCLDRDGKPVFEHCVQRLHPTTEAGIERARARHPSVCYVFDCLYLDGRPIVSDPLARRREWLADAIRENGVYRVSEAVEEGLQLYEAARKLGLEGIVAKERESPYLHGRRTSHWLKIKSRQTTECIIIGCTRGKGDRDGSFGALHLGRYKGGRLFYMGKVGTGFDERLYRAILTELQKISPAPRPIEQRPADDARTVWFEPKLVCEVQYASLTTTGTLREPVFVRLRPDLVPENCRTDA